jgi:hypothetical protein
MGKYPGWRTMTAAQRYNARYDRIWEEARMRERAKEHDYFAPDTYAENPPHGAPGHRLSRNCDQCVENGS